MKRVPIPIINCLSNVEGKMDDKYSTKAFTIKYMDSQLQATHVDTNQIAVNVYVDISGSGDKVLV